MYYIIVINMIKTCRICKNDFKTIYYNKLSCNNEDCIIINKKIIKKNASKKYGILNREDITNKTKLWRNENKEKYIINSNLYNFKWRNENKEKFSLQRKKYKINNKDKLSKWNKTYYEKNKNKINNYKKKWSNDRYHNDVLYNLQIKIRGRLGHIFRGEKYYKKDKTFDLIGCSPKELKKHIENQFTDGMSWSNYERFGWHIDHKILLSSAKNENELHRLCHYSNLRPLWASDNLSRKYNERIETYIND